jgi:FkbH-like protein
MMTPMDFQTLKRQARGIDPSGFPKVRVALLGNHATQFLGKALGYWGLLQRTDCVLYEGEYDQTDMEIIDPGSGLYAFAPEFVVLSISSLKLQDKFYALPPGARAGFASDYAHHIAELVELLTSRLDCRIILNNLEQLNDHVYGNLFSKAEQSFPHQLYRLNDQLLKMSLERPALYLFDLNGLVQRHGATHVRDWSQYVHADIHYALDFQVLLAEGWLRFIQAFRGRLHKCLVLDLDNTLWGGVIGDDGIKGIEVGNLGIGKAFTGFQKWIKELKERGIILAVCSKNTDAVARTPFESHPDMVLRLEDIAVFIANWENKADNIRAIQEILNIGFDSMVFVDDNPAEREMVRQNLPKVCVPELPEDPALYTDYLKSLELFETPAQAEGDKERTQQYQQEAERKKMQFSMTNMEDYLKSLDMTIRIAPFEAIDLPRIAQLSQRSNQFNLRTIRYAEHTLAELASRPGFHTVSVKLEDKFGDYGLISVLILEPRADGALFIDTWLMSCRVLKRGVESAVLNYCAGLAAKDGYKTLVGEYIPTEKNALVKDHYAQLNFVPKDGFWYLDLEHFIPHTHYIQA